MISYYAADHAPARDSLARALEVDPAFPLARMLRALVLSDLGEHEAAVREVMDAAAQTPTAELVSARGCVAARAGDRAEAHRVLGELAEMEQRCYVSPVLRAQVYAALDEAEAVLTELERATEGRALDLAWFKVRPVFRGLRAHDRYRALLARVGLL